MLIVNWFDLLDGLKHKPKLAANQIHLWQASVSGSAESLSCAAAVLSEDERARAGRFHFQQDRDSYVVSRGILRHLLAAYTGAGAGKIQFQYGVQGKPAIAADSRVPHLQFNVSHSGDVVLLGFALGRAIGVDVERLQNDRDFAGLAAHSFSQSERDAVLALPPDKQASMFYEYWTCKEACIKWDGRGVSVPLDQFSVVASREGIQWREIGQARARVFESEVRVRILDTIPGYAAAVAANGKGWDALSMDLAAVNAQMD